MPQSIYSDPFWYWCACSVSVSVMQTSPHPKLIWHNNSNEASKTLPISIHFHDSFFLNCSVFTGNKTSLLNITTSATWDYQLWCMFPRQLRVQNRWLNCGAWLTRTSGMQPKRLSYLSVTFDLLLKPEFQYTTVVMTTIVFPWMTELQVNERQIMLIRSTIHYNWSLSSSPTKSVLIRLKRTW